MVEKIERGEALRDVLVARLSETRRPSTRARRPRAFVGTEIATTVTAAPAMVCSAAALATPVFTTASRPVSRAVSKSSRGVPDVGGPAARRHPARSLAPRASADAASAATAISWPEGAGAAEIGATKATASVANLGARGEIATGLPFLDHMICLLYTSPSPRDGLLSRMPSSA